MDSRRKRLILKMLHTYSSTRCMLRIRLLRLPLTLFSVVFTTHSLEDDRSQNKEPGNQTKAYHQGIHHLYLSMKMRPPVWPLVLPKVHQKGYQPKKDQFMRIRKPADSSKDTTVCGPREAPKELIILRLRALMKAPMLT